MFRQLEAIGASRRGFCWAQVGLTGLDWAQPGWAAGLSGLAGWGDDKMRRWEDEKMGQGVWHAGPKSVIAWAMAG